MPKKSRSILDVVRIQWHAHTRFFVAVLFGLVIWAASFQIDAQLGAVTRFLFGWNAGVWLFIVLVLRMMTRATMADLRKRAGMEDEGRAATLAFVTTATVVALVALAFELADAMKNDANYPNLRIALALFAIFGSWLFINFAFALHYAHEVYRTKQSLTALAFPNEKQPDYWDFVYFAMVMGTTFQTSDVDIRSRNLRRTATAQGLVAFVFNTAIIALTVSIASKLLGG